MIRTEQPFSVLPNWLARSGRAIPRITRLVLIVLNSYVHQEDGAWAVSLSQLATDLDLSTHQVSEHIDWLKKHSLITVKRQGLGRSNSYHLEWGAIQDFCREHNSDQQQATSGDDQTEPGNTSNPDLMETSNQESGKILDYKEIQKKSERNRYSSIPSGNSLKADPIVLANASVAQHTQIQEAVVQAVEQESPMQHSQQQYTLPLDVEIITTDQAQGVTKNPKEKKPIKAQARKQPHGEPLTPEQKQAKALLVGNAKRLFKPGEIPTESHKYGLAIRLARQFPLDVIERNVYHLLQRQVPADGFGIGYLFKAFKEDYAAAENSSSMNERMMAQHGQEQRQQQQRHGTGMALGAASENPKNPENFPRLSKRDESTFATDNDPLRTSRGRSQRQLDTWNGDRSRSLWNKSQAQLSEGTGT